ncbi:CRISPR-associated endonuclease/helicase Cas3 [Clostridiales Family XIII bacterium PM5-7]
MNNQHIAHAEKRNGQIVTQTVRDHCIAVAEYASENLKGIGLYHTAYVAGILHDMGKSRQEVKDYLIESNTSNESIARTVNHSFAAVIYILEKYHVQKEDELFIENITAEIIAYACAAHHGAIDLVDINGKSGFVHRLKKGKKEIGYEESKENFFKEVISEEELDVLFRKAIKEIESFFDNLKLHSSSSNEVYFAFGFLARMVLSAVVDGDRRDAMEFAEEEKNQYRKMTRGDWETQLAFLENKIKKFKADSDINKVRKKISDQCCIEAERSTGIYKISAPTGAAKTLATLRYALKHAAETGKERIFFIIPLLSILDQNSEEIRKYIKDEDIILEHHSDVVRQKKSEDDQLDKRELLVQNWESPIVISTLVQLLTTCFSHRNTPARRLKSLCNSVIVIDEIQSLPIKFTAIFNQVVNFLSENCNTTIVLSSATQPCFEEIITPMRVNKEELVELSEEERNVFKRVSLVNKITPEGSTLEEIAEFVEELIASKDSILIICNTKSEARNLYQLLAKIKSDNVERYHLSTGMCKEHRKVVLEKIGKTPGLHAERKVICVSTQLVEAGIDFSFETVIRFEAGIENIIQAAGRANRNNEWGRLCETYIVRIKAEQLGSLDDIKKRKRCFSKVNALFEESPEEFENDLMSNSIIEKYYQYLFEDNKDKVKFPIEIEGSGFDILDMLTTFEKISKDESGGAYWLRQPFKTAGEHCKIFEDNTTDVIVPYDKKGKEVINNLCSQKAKTDFRYLRGQIENARPYTVSLYDHEIKKLDGMIESVANDSVFVLYESAYSEKIGVCLDGTIITEDLMNC